MELIMGKKNLFGLKCECCGSDITAPQFHNGKMYGYTCITKVAPKQKKNSAKDLIVIRFDHVEDNIDNFIPFNKSKIMRSDRIKYRFTLSNGVKLSIPVYLVYSTIAGLTPRSETEFAYGSKVHIDFEKKILITPKDMWHQETLDKLPR